MFKICGRIEFLWFFYTTFIMKIIFFLII